MRDLTWLMGLLRQASPTTHADGIDPDLPLSQQGVDSLDFMAFLLLVEESKGIKIPDADVPNLSSLSLIDAYVTARSSEQSG